jgi:predicted ATPase
VAFIEYVLDDPIRNCVEEAVDMNILLYLHDGMDGKRYTFAHENIQMSVYHLIPESEREFFHLEIGRRIWHRLDQNELDRNIYVVLSQVWIGRRLIEQYSERYQIAALCLRAGQKAAKSSAFRISLFYLEFGVELLGDRGWCDEYDLTLTLYNATAEMEVYNSKYDKMELLFNDILKNGRCADDTIQARRTQVYALCVSDRHHEGLNQGIQLMADLGFAFPRHFSLWALRNEVKAVLLLLKGKSNDYLKRLPIIDNSNALAAMHVLHVVRCGYYNVLKANSITPTSFLFFSQLSIHASLARPRLAIFVSLKMIKLTLKYGLSFMSPLAFSTFGMLCIKIFPTTEAALRYGELSLELLDQFQVREYLPRVYIGYYACTYPWKHHISDSLDYLIRAERVGIQTGDVEAACLCANIWGYMATDADIPLDEIEAHFLNFQATLKSRRQKLSMQLSFSLLQTIQYLQGKDVDFIDTERLLQYSVENKVVLKMANIRWWQAKMALLFNDWSRADEIAYTANFFKNQHNIPPTSEIVQTAFVNGMIALVMASQPRHGDNAYRPRRTRRQYIAEGQRVIRFLEKYVLWAPTNYYDKQMLLKAELAVVKGQTEEAMRQYVCAIALSKLSRNRLVEGLSNERAGRYCLSVLNDSSMAMKYFDAALSVYKEWKAHRKVDHLQLEMKTLLALHQSQHNCQC